MKFEQSEKKLFSSCLLPLKAELLADYYMISSEIHQVSVLYQNVNAP